MSGGLRSWFPVLALLMALPAGCAMTPQEGGPNRPPASKSGSENKSRGSKEALTGEVAKVICLYEVSAFQSFDEAGDPDPEGFRVTVVLASRRSQKGVAEDGVIKTRMYRVDPTGPDKTTRTLVREWDVDTAGLHTYRSGVLGEGYKLSFEWAKEDAVLGKEIEIVVSFEGRDGRVIRSQTKALRVPAHKST
jgi:hypothetical protein